MEDDTSIFACWLPSLFALRGFGGFVPPASVFCCNFRIACRMPRTTGVAAILRSISKWRFAAVVRFQEGFDLFASGARAGWSVRILFGLTILLASSRTECKR
jgi:hypothetical protein